MMAYDVEGTIEIITASLSLGKKLVEILSADSEAGKDPSIAAALQQLRGQVLQASEELGRQLRTLRIDFEKQGIDIGRTVDQLYGDLNFYNVFKRMKITEFRDRMLGLYLSFHSFLNNAAAILECARKTPTVKNAFEMARKKMRDKLDKMNISNTPINEFLNLFIDLADEMAQALR